MSQKRINLVYDDVNRYFHVINNLTGAMARGYVCRGCKKDVNGARLISVERRLATASRFLRVRSLKNESRASPVIEALEVARVTKNKTNKLGGKKTAKRCEIAPVVTCA
jgi:ABC-type lipopolysaccharide export system ATPase subunit